MSYIYTGLLFLLLSWQITLFITPFLVWASVCRTTFSLKTFFLIQKEVCMSAEHYANKMSKDLTDPTTAKIYKYTIISSMIYSGMHTNLEVHLIL